MAKLKTHKKIILILLGIVAAVVILEAGLNILSGIYIKRHLPRYEFKDNADKGILRILCLGDSFTYGIGADFENSYPAQLERMLNENSKVKKFKVFNEGVPGSNSSQVFVKFNDIVDEVRPDIVIILAGGNDIWSVGNILCGRVPMGLRIKNMLVLSRSFRACSILGVNIKSAIADKISKNKSRNIKKSVNEFTAAQLLEKGNYFKETNQYDSARLCYEKILENDPDNKAIILELAHCYKFQRKFDEAVDLLTGMFMQQPEDKQIRAEIKDMFIQLNNPAKALVYYERLYRKFPDNRFARQELANTHVRLAGDYLMTLRLNKALDAYSRAHELNPADPRALEGMQMIEDWEKTGTSSKINQAVLEKLAKFDIVMAPYNYADDVLYNNLKEIIKLCEKNKITLIFSSYPLEVPAAMRELSLGRDILLVDHTATFKTLLQNEPRDKYFISAYDSHCLSAGYEVMARNLAKEILKLIENKYPNGVEYL
ncbi:MAG: tetratricopeptide repeat protein [Candidatus Omnitrophica bacterium]|nr:tetratricopeptide repeat protein [Candidatus Omnitrophota bacterium]MBU1925988.1 tetratricopeptide repeat protein [Candidatus Omnitrophota bacterium]